MFLIWRWLCRCRHCLLSLSHIIYKCSLTFGLWFCSIFEMSAKFAHDSKAPNFRNVVINIMRQLMLIFFLINRPTFNYTLFFWFEMTMIRFINRFFFRFVEIFLFVCLFGRRVIINKSFRKCQIYNVILLWIAVSILWK